MARVQLFLICVLFVLWSWIYMQFASGCQSFALLFIYVFPWTLLRIRNHFDSITTTTLLTIGDGFVMDELNLRLRLCHTSDSNLHSYTEDNPLSLPSLVLGRFIRQRVLEKDRTHRPPHYYCFRSNCLPSCSELPYTVAARSSSAVDPSLPERSFSVIRLWRFSNASAR